MSDPTLVPEIRASNAEGVTHNIESVALTAATILDVLGLPADHEDTRVLLRHCKGGSAKCDAVVTLGPSIEVIDWKFKKARPVQPR